MTRRAKRICGRSLSAGPGSCNAWWDSCPHSVGHCFMRFIQERTGRDYGGSIDMETAKEWEAARDRAVDPEPSLL